MSVKQRLLPMIDVLALPFVFPAAWLLKNIRRLGVHRLPFCRRALLAVGVFPIRNHYYEPQFDSRATKRALDSERPLPGIDWNVPEQLATLSSLNFAHEIAELSAPPADDFGFFFGNGTFESGDAEFWYQLIRSKKPRRIIEVGSGNSTRLAVAAIRRNQADDSTYHCEHICIEPYENPWLEKAGLTVWRQKVEDIDPDFFQVLNANDILFIDSSHIIRPEGDVLFEYLELLPTLRAGVIVHVHDIFSPRNYLSEWLVDRVLFWNEQYLLEAFLTHNRTWRIIGALNFLHHNHATQLQRVCPMLTNDREPGSFYLQKSS